MKVYKVVSRSTVSTHSPPSWKYTSSVVKGKAEVTYMVGEPVSAPRWLEDLGYYLTAFKTLEDAKHFSKYTSSVIFLADVNVIIEELPPALSIRDLFWGGHKELTNPSWPDGTVMCKELTLIEEVRIT